MIKLGDGWEEVFGTILLLLGEVHLTHLKVDHLNHLGTHFYCYRQKDDITHVPAQIL